MSAGRPMGLPVPGVSRAGAQGSYPVTPSAKAVAAGVAAPAQQGQVQGVPVAQQRTENAPRLLSNDPSAMHSVPGAPSGQGPGRPMPRSGQVISPSERPVTEFAVIESCDGSNYVFRKKRGRSDPRFPDLSTVRDLQDMFTIFMAELAKGADYQQAANHILSRYKVTLRDKDGLAYYDVNKSEQYGAPAVAPDALEEMDFHGGTDGISLPES